MDQLSLITAFGAGLLTFFAPCTFVALPAFITYITSQATDKNRRVTIVTSALAYVLGFLLIFTLLGFTAASLSHLLVRNRDLLIQIGGVMIILMGVLLLFGDRLGKISLKLYRDRRITVVPGGKVVRGYLFPFAIGATSALAWSPCIGPVLGGILFLAGVSSENPLQGALLLLLYGLGITLPFLLLSIFFERSKGVVQKLGKYSEILFKLTAILLILLGVGLLTGYYDTFSAYIFNLFDSLGYHPL